MFSFDLRFGLRTQFFKRADVQGPARPVFQQLLARVRDVEITHRQLANPIQRRELSFPAFHAQPLRMVGQAGAGGFHDRVIVAASEFDNDVAGDHAGYPTLQGVAQHERLRVEPAALIKQSAQPPPVASIVFDGAFVVDGIHQSLVGDE